MSGSRHVQLHLPQAHELRGVVATWSRALADWLVGPVERWCPICELELKLHAADRSCLASSGDED